MQIIAAIDVGSNAMRRVVGRIVYDAKAGAIEKLRLIERIARSTGIVISGEKKAWLIHKSWNNK